MSALERVVPTHAPAHIRGETGTGKELIARALHARGPRADKAFVVHNCAGFTDSLLQSALFGHKKGAFTGADTDRIGMFQAADGGTLFLDEVAELTPQAQAALLRALQYGEIVPVGSTQSITVDVRVISATHKDLRQLSVEGGFRADLLYRLLVLIIDLPPLREREDDIALLAMHFLDDANARYGRQVAGFSDFAMRAIERYGWPGNVRELGSEIARAVLAGKDGESLTTAHLSPELRAASELPPAHLGATTATSRPIVISSAMGYDAAVEQLEKSLVERALRKSKGVVARAADLLDMDRSRLAKLRRRLGFRD